MRRIRGWSKAGWAIAIAGLLWVPVLLLSLWAMQQPVSAGNDEMAKLVPLVLIPGSLIGLGATFVMLWLVFAVGQRVLKARSSGR